MRRAEVAGAVEESDEDRTISIHSAGAGYRDDGDAGLLHVGARYYDPQAGRFISRDAVLSEHPYLYCEHEPVNYVDPSGRAGILAYLVYLGLAAAATSMLAGCKPGTPSPSPQPQRPVPTPPNPGCPPDTDGDGFPDPQDKYPGDKFRK